MKYDCSQLSLARRVVDRRIGAGRVPGRDLGLAGRAAGPGRARPRKTTTHRGRAIATGSWSPSSSA